MEVSLVCGLIAMFCWGIADFLQARGIRSVGTPQAMMIRNLLTLTLSIFVGVVLFTTREISWQMYDVMTIFMSSIIYVIGYTFYMRGIEFGRLSVVEPVASSYALITLFLVVTLTDEVVTSLQGLGILITVSGIVFIAGDPRKIILTSDKVSVFNGSVALVLFGIAFSVLGAGSQRMSSADAFLIAIFSQSIIFLTMAVIIGARFQQVLTTPPSMLRVFIYHSIILNIAWVGYMYGVANGNVSMVTAISSAFGGVGALLGILLFKERLRVSQYVGIALIIIGVVVMSQ